MPGKDIPSATTTAPPPPRRASSRSAGSRRPLAWLTAGVLPVSALLALAAPGRVFAAPPTSVTVAGSFQSEVGCPGDWQPDCAATHLAYDAGDDVWQQSFSLPAGTWEYKGALNDSWTENYGLGGALNGANISFTLAASTTVKFYYDPATHWITDGVTSVIVTAPGSFQSELGCSGDWQPDCLRSWLQDPDGDGIYQRTTTAIPAGTYETKAAIAESWTENYGLGGVPNGTNIPFTVPPNATVRFSYDSKSHVLTVEVTAPTTPTPTTTTSASDGSGTGTGLAATGSSAPVALAAVGLAMVLLGLGLVLTVRRRRALT